MGNGAGEGVVFLCVYFMVQYLLRRHLPDLVGDCDGTSAVLLCDYFMV